MARAESRTTIDRVLPWCIAAGFFGIYLLGEQANPGVDPVMFAYRGDDPSIAIRHPSHPVFGPILEIFMGLGRVAGIDAWTAGLLHSVLFTALALLLYYRLLRRLGVGIGVSGLHAALLGACTPVMENATTVELYAPCLFASLLVIHAFLSVGRAPDFRGMLWLWLSALYLFLLHIGFAFLILAAYVTLAWRDRARMRHSISRLLQGATIPALYLIWLYLNGYMTAEASERTAEFFGKYWMAESSEGFAWHLFKAPLYHVAAQAGLLIFPAVIGWRAFRKSEPKLFMLAGLSAVLFLGHYSFWVTDRGSFYLPILPIWGAFAALALDRLLRTNRRALVFTAATPLYTGLFIILPLGDYATDASAMSRTIVCLFIAFCLASWFIGKPFDRSEPAEDIRPRAACRFLLPAMIAACTCAAYLPSFLEQREPDTTTLIWREFKRHAPDEARLATALWRNRAAVQTGHPCIEVNALDEKVAVRLTQWLKESRQPEGPALILDRFCYDFKAKLWAAGDGVTPPLNEWAFIPLPLEHHTFYRVVPRDQHGSGSRQ